MNWWIRLISFFAILPLCAVFIVAVGRLLFFLSFHVFVVNQLFSILDCLFFSVVEWNSIFSFRFLFYNFLYFIWYIWICSVPFDAVRGKGRNDWFGGVSSVYISYFRWCLPNLGQFQGIWRPTQGTACLR